MSNQKKGAGHHAITLEATRHLFNKSVHNGKILGLTEHAFYKKLDKWQEHADRVVGPTWQPYWFVPHAQREHAMGVPGKSGEQNLKDIKSFILHELSAAKFAHSQGDSISEWQHLGAAVHALEDSYSSAHIFRDPLDPTNPYAAVQAINTFAWMGSHDTHNEDFDDVPLSDGHLVRGTDLASAIAVANILLLYVEHYEDSMDATRPLFDNELSALLHGENILVISDSHSKEFQDQTHAHYNNELSQVTDTVHHGPDSSQPDDVPNFTSESNMTLNDGTTINQSADQPGNSQIYSPDDANMNLYDGSFIHHGIDSDQPGDSPDVHPSLNDGTTFHETAIQHDSSQVYSAENANMSMYDGTTTHHGADSSQPDHSQNYSTMEMNGSFYDAMTNHHGADSSQPDHSQINSSDPDMAQHDGTTVHHGADSSQPDHSSSDSNQSHHHGSSNHHGTDSSQPDHSQNYSSVEADMSSYNGGGVHHGTDSSQPDHSSQSQSHESGQANSHQSQSQSVIGAHNVDHSGEASMCEQ